MTCNISTTPLDVEPLPLYQRDPETSSILSSAPSYISEAPTYHSRRPSIPALGSNPPQQQPYYINTSLLDISAPPRSRQNHNSISNANASVDSASPPPARQGLPAPRYAPGFHSRALGSVNDVELHNFNVGHWSSITSSHARRQYQNVASRRANRAAGADRTAVLLESMSLSGENPPPLPSSSLLDIGSPRMGTQSPASTTPLSRSRASTPPPIIHQNTAPAAAPSANLLTTATSASSIDNPTNASSPGSFTQPVNPLEDAALVGEVAAMRARQQRLYREACLRHDNQAQLQQEGKTWDFLLAQMTDWEERERSWGRFRADVEARRGRIGAMGFGVGRLGAGGAKKPRKKGASGDWMIGGWGFGGRGKMGAR